MDAPVAPGIHLSLNRTPCPIVSVAGQHAAPEPPPPMCGAVRQLQCATRSDRFRGRALQTLELGQYGEIAEPGSAGLVEGSGTVMGQLIRSAQRPCECEAAVLLSHRFQFRRQPLIGR